MKNIFQWLFKGRPKLSLGNRIDPNRISEYMGQKIILKKGKDLDEVTVKFGVNGMPFHFLMSGKYPQPLEVLMPGYSLDGELYEKQIEP
jgi:hypothetical protein